MTFIKGQQSWNKGKPYFAIRGENHPNWKGGKEYSHGYIIIINHSHPFADKRGRIFEHRIVMEKIIGRYLLPKEVVHHINGKKDDNRPENLRLYNTAGQHIKKEHPETIAPIFHKFICENCYKTFYLTGRQKYNRNGRFCSYPCFNLWRTPKTTCKKCSLKIHARGLCNKHYRYLLRYLSR